ncbi:hypothetical protein SDC9_129989 [bioreactor metagenome]|uniref:Uncharacterized protein n=1 Tax=bioreactor metagenome TaxID=1076179 RepID=A0A645D156_9ZZZZ
MLNVDGLDAEFVNISTVVVLGVGDSRLQHLLDDHGSFFLRELEGVQSLINLLAADQIRDQATLVNRQTDAPEDCTCFRHGRSLLLLDFFVRRVTLEGARQGEFAQLVAHHLVGNVDRHVLLAVVHGDGQTDELGQNHGATRPGLDWLLVLGGDGLFDLSQQVMVNKRTLFERTSHLLPLTSYDATRSWSVCACCYGCGSPSSDCPMGQLGDGLHRSYLHHHRAGGRQGS